MPWPGDLPEAPAKAPAPAPAPAPALASRTSEDEPADHSPLANRHSFWTHLNALAAEYKTMEAEVHQLRSQEHEKFADVDCSSELDRPVPSDRDASSVFPIVDSSANVIFDFPVKPLSPFVSTSSIDHADTTGQPSSVDDLVAKPSEERASRNSLSSEFSARRSATLKEVFEESIEAGKSVIRRGSSKGLKGFAFGKGMEDDTDVFDRVTTMEMKNIYFEEALKGKITVDFFVNSFMDFVVISNIILLGFQAGSTWDGWLFVDIFFAIAFCLEILYKMASQKQQYCNLRNPDFKWQIFDIALAVLSVFDVGISYHGHNSSSHDSNYTWMRIARLIRIARVLRLLQLDIFRDLLLMINGAVGGLRTLAWSIVMITVPIYVFALFYTEMVGVVAFKEDDAASNFRSIGASMFTGFRCLVVGDCSQEDGTPIFVHLVKDYGWMYGVVYAITSVCMSFGLFNVIIAIYVENTVAAAKSNELVQRQRRLEDQSHFFAKIVDLLHFLWNTYPKRMTQPFNWEEAMELEVTEEYFKDLLQMPKLRMLLSDLDVPKEDHHDLFDICDADSSGIVTMDELVAGIRRLRGDPRRSDIVYIMLRVREVLAEVQGMREHGVATCRPSERTRSSSNNLDHIRNKLEQSSKVNSQAGQSNNSKASWKPLPTSQ